MKLRFHLLDCDYFMNGNTPVIRMFGKAQDGGSVCAFYNGVKPYFYVLLEDSQSEKQFKDLESFLQRKFPGLFGSLEKVKKFLPIWYKEDRFDLVKIILSDPSKVPLVRDELRQQHFVKEIYEADIPFKYRFMVDHGLSGMGNVEVEGEVTQTRTVKTKYKIEAADAKAVEDTPLPNLNYMAIDIEVASAREGLPDPRHDPISMISMAFNPVHNGLSSMVFMVKSVKGNGDSSVKMFASEKEMLEEFTRVVGSFDPDAIIGYNINGFDLPYIIERYTQNSLPSSLGRCAKKPARARKFGMINRSDIVGRVVSDAYDLVKESASKGIIKLKRYGLGDVSKLLLNQDKIDISHSEIVKYWNGDADKILKLIEYARKDSILALKLVLEKGLMDKFIALSKVTGVLLQDSLSSGEATRIETYLLKEFNSRDFVVPCKPEPSEISRRNVERETHELKGAIVLEPETGLHTMSIIYLDFKSMYPSIYISYNICPTTLLEKNSTVKGLDTPYGVKFASKDIRRGIIPQIVERLIAERDLIKKQMKSAKDQNTKKELDAKQLALKITANAFYGYTGYIRAKLYVLDIANAITSCGRYLITKTRDTIDKDDRFKVIYGDTDSVMVKTKTADLDEALKFGEELEKTINKELEGIVQMKIESIFKSIVILTKKRYAAWSFEKTSSGWEDKIIMKGIETVRRDWCDLVSDTLYAILEIILKEQNPKKAFDYVKGVLKKLQNNEIPVEQLVITKSVTKPITSYKGIQPHIELVKKMRKRNPTDAPGVGDRVGFVIIQGLQMLSNRAEDPEYVKQNNLKVDSKYYIENQLMPPLERVFESIGIDKSELIGSGKQMSLASLFGKVAPIQGSATKALEGNGPLNSMDGILCEKCGKIYRRPPLTGKCENCGGPFLFCRGREVSKHLLM